MMMNVASMIYNMRFSENEDFRSISLIINKEMLINRIRGYEEILDLFKQYLPQKAREQLTYRLKYWFKKHLLLADLSKNEFFGVLSECRSLFSNLYSDDSVMICSEFADIFKAISNGDFEGVYDYYLNHGNFN